MAGYGKRPMPELYGRRFLTASRWARSARLPWLPPILKLFMPEPARPTFAKTSLPVMESTNPLMAVQRGSTSAWRTRARSAGLSSIRRIRASFMWALWGTCMVRAKTGASTNPSMEDRIGRGFSAWGRKSAFQIWQCALPRRSFCLQEYGIRGVPRGALMPLSMDLVAVFTVLRMPAKPGHGSLEMEIGEMETGKMETGYPKAIGDALASRLHRRA